MNAYSSKITMKNKPKCMFCDAPLIAEDVSITKNVSSYYATGKANPILVPNGDEIQLRLRCPNCGSLGEGLGDRFQYSVKNSTHEIIINNVAVLRQNGPDLNHPLPANVLERKKFNPSRRDNEY